LKVSVSEELTTVLKCYRKARVLVDHVWMLIPLKVGSDSDLNPVTGSGVKPGVFGAQRRWHSYRA
jgi:hypothetical protein